MKEEQGEFASLLSAHFPDVISDRLRIFLFALEFPDTGGAHVIRAIRTFLDDHRGVHC